MTIELISCYYREHYLVPLFMNHYESWVDKVTFLTRRYPGGRIDDTLKQAWFNEAVGASEADWVVVVDLDEFVCPREGAPPREVLREEQGNVIFCRLVTSYRHESDETLDVTRLPIPQRRHGVPALSCAPNSTASSSKPNVFRPRGAVLGVGNHSISIEGGEHWGREWVGAHWAFADPVFALPRVLQDRRDRMNAANEIHHWGFHYRDLTHSSIVEMLHAHRQDPIVI